MRRGDIGQVTSRHCDQKLRGDWQKVLLNAVVLLKEKQDILRLKTAERNCAYPSIKRKYSSRSIPAVFRLVRMIAAGTSS